MPPSILIWGTGTWSGGTSDGITLWFVIDTTSNTPGNSAYTRVRQTWCYAITLLLYDINSWGSNVRVQWRSAVFGGITVWFGRNDINVTLALAYTGRSTRARNAALDIVVGTGYGQWLDGLMALPYGLCATGEAQRVATAYIHGEFANVAVGSGSTYSSNSNG